MSVFRQLDLPRGTILLVDDGAADIISLIDDGSLIPDVFVMICSIGTPADLTALFERLISVVEFQHIALFVTRPIDNYAKQIKCINDFGEFDIARIIGTAGAALPANPPRYITLPGIIVPVCDLFTLVPTFPPVLDGLLGFDEFCSEYDAADAVTHALEALGTATFHAYSVGAFSSRVQRVLEENRNGDSRTAVLLVDRTEFCAPLFAQNSASLLDRAAAACPTAVLRDRSFIDAEIARGADGLTDDIAHLLDGSACLITLEKRWRALSDSERFLLSAQHPSLPYILTPQDAQEAQISQFEESLLQGCDFEDLLAAAPLDLRVRVAFTTFRHLISPLPDISDILSDAFSECNEGCDGVRSEDDLRTVLTHCNSGVHLRPTAQNSRKSLYALPELLRGVLQRDSPLDSRIQSPHSGLLGKMFRARTRSLCDFDDVYIFVIGGVSFYELSLLTSLIASGDTSAHIHVLSDSLSASHCVLTV